MSAGQDPSGASVEVRPASELGGLEAPWRDLMGRTEEPNAFADPSFVLPALRHIAPHGLEAVLAWSGPGRDRLDGLAILRTPRTAPGIARVWMSEQATSPALLLDSRRGQAALRAVTTWIAGRRRLALGLGLPSLDRRGGAAEAVRAVARARAVRPVVANERRRAVLLCGATADFEAERDGKRRKEWRRQRRRLEERAGVAFAWSADATAFEAFLALEAAGWKGARGSALAASPPRAAFARAMFRDFASRGQARVATLSQGDRAIAAGVALLAGSRAFYWKTAFDERLAESSPGVQLSLDMSRDLQREPGLAMVDSCAAPDHPMIDRLWPARIDVGDFVIPIRPGPALTSALAWLDARAFVKSEVKRHVASWRGRR